MVYQKMDAQHKQNSKELERFGYEMVATSRSMETTGKLGAVQLPPTFDLDKLTPTQKVIHGLMRDKDGLLDENKVLQSEIEKLESKIQELTEYKELNEHFAPQKLKDELRSVERQLKAFLIRSPDADRFSTIQIEIMSAAGAAEYKAYITRNRLMLSEDMKLAVISDYLPAYAFCVGDGVEVAANSRTEERKLANYFRTEDSSPLSEVLFQDLSSVLAPCQLSVRKKLDRDKV
ncbi:hypothetical protein [Neptunomonas japonica]|uniref:hypothetical protein n=1 Tax=Neptunomonas japonica TaxID=417574 RepID=UPI000406078B|nr:hypothetical protein [Neptunomonas japonica]